MGRQHNLDLKMLSKFNVDRNIISASTLRNEANKPTEPFSSFTVYYFVEQKGEKNYF